MRRLLAGMVMGMVALVQGCATPIPETFAFGPNSDKALAMVVGPMAYDASYIELRQVDLETGTLGPEIVTVSNALLEGNRINPNSQIWLSPRELSGGHYAVVYISVSEFNGVSNSHHSRCLASGAPVYHFPKGQISVIQVNSSLLAMQMGKLFTEVAPIDAVRAEFARARSAFPALIGELQPAQPAGSIAWVPRGRFNAIEHCRPASPNLTAMSAPPG